MAEPIYRLVILGPSESLARLPEKDRNRMIKERNSNLRDLGGRRIVACSCLEHWNHFLVVEFPDGEALRKRRDFVRDLHAKYKVAHTELSLLGFKSAGDLETTDLPCFRLYADKGPQGTYKPTEEDIESIRTNVADLGGRLVIGCRALEIPWLRFGIQQWPSLEAIDEHSTWLRHYLRGKGGYWDGLSLVGFKIG